MVKRFIAGSIAAFVVATQVLSPLECKAAQLDNNETVKAQEQTEVSTDTQVVSAQGVEGESDNLTGKIISIDKFGLYGSDKYDSYAAQYRVNIAEINTNNNNGCYGSSVISNAIDNDFNTYWETNKSNSTSFTNEVVLSLASATEIGSIVYSARKDGAAGKGFPTKLSVYGATTEGEYSLIGTGEYSGAVTDVIEIAFKKTTVKYIKFVFDEANQGYASAAEFQIYKEDSVRRMMKNLFTDGTCVEVSPEYATLDKLNQAKNLLVNHPLRDDYESDIDLAIKILTTGIDTTDRMFTANQYGNVANHSKNDLRFNYGAASNYQSTGIASLANEEIVVYVDVENEKYIPQLIFTQFDGDNSGWWQYVSLKKGKNVIKTPFKTYSLGYNENWAEPVNAGGAIYICNPYTPEQQGRAPKIRIEGGTVFPLLKLDSDDDQFVEKLTQYMEKVNADAKEYPNIIDRKVFDIFEFEIDHLIFTGTASGAYEAFVTNGRSPHEVIQSWDTYLDGIFKFVGLDGVDENGNYNKYDDGAHVKQHIFVAQRVGWMVACANHIGIWTSQVSGLLNTFEAARGNWGIAHEIGHTMDIGSRTYKESTNNMLALYTAAVYGRGYSENRVPYEGFTYKSTTSDSPVSYMDQDFFQRMGVFWQLELYHPGYWGELNSSYRESCPSYSSVASGDENVAKQQEIIIRSCDILKLDLSDYFYRHGFSVTDATKQTTAKYAKSDKLWYLNDGVYEYKGDGLNSSTEVTVSTKVDIANSQITINMGIGSKDRDDLLGYEISRDGKVIGFTGNNNFVDTTVDVTKNCKYTVVAYGYDMSKANPVSIDSMAPSLLLDSEVIVGLNDTFEPLEYVSATDYKGNALTNITVTGTVDTKKKGKSNLTYSVTADGKTVTKKMCVEVVSEKSSLTEYKYDSISVGYGTPRVDNNLSLNVYGNKKAFDTGLYMHAPANVVYDLTEAKKLKYDRFEAWVGIDGTIAEQSNSSVKFEFYLDDVLVYNTGVMTYYSNAEHVYFNLNNASKLKIVVSDAGNGKSADHTVIGGMYLITNNASPKITIPKDIAIEVGDKIDLKAGCSANDAEDGDLTGKVVVTGNVDTTKAGNYKVTYSVTDSNGNKTTKVRTIGVTDLKNSIQLAADDAKKISASNGYGAMGINVSNGGNQLKLTNADGTIESYTSGLGVHANSTVIYDISDDDYDFFTVDAGVDRECYGNANTSVRMYIYCDDELRYDSGVLTSKMPLQHVKISVKGVSKLKLVVLDCGSNANDHADWCDMKLYPAVKELKAGLKVNNMSTSFDAEVGEVMTLNASANGGSGVYSYKYVVKNLENNVEYTIKDYCSSMLCTCKLTSEGRKQYIVYVKDSNGDTAVSNSVIVTAANTSFTGSLKVNGSTSLINAKVGSSVTLNASATGGAGSYTYKYVVKNLSNGVVFTIKDYSTNTTCV